MDDSDAEHDGFIDVDRDDDTTSVQYEQVPVRRRHFRSLNYVLLTRLYNRQPRQLSLNLLHRGL